MMANYYIWIHLLGTIISIWPFLRSIYSKMIHLYIIVFYHQSSSISIYSNLALPYSKWNDLVMVKIINKMSGITFCIEWKQYHLFHCNIINLSSTIQELIKMQYFSLIYTFKILVLVYTQGQRNVFHFTRWCFNTN